MKKMGLLVWFSCLLRKLMFLKLSKIVSFLEFFANVSKKSKTDLVTYVCGSKRSHFSLLENGILYYDFT